MDNGTHIKFTKEQTERLHKITQALNEDELYLMISSESAMSIRWIDEVFLPMLRDRCSGDIIEDCEKHFSEIKCILKRNVLD
jgi:hypothetical protein